MLREQHATRSARGMMRGGGRGLDNIILQKQHCELGKLGVRATLRLAP